MSNWRWWLCSLLFVATTVNYLDRQVLSLTYEEFIKPQFHWNDANYGTITSFFSIFYAVACLFAGKFVDWMGTKRGYLIAIFVWSLGACMHAACGWATALFVDGVSNAAALKAVEAGSKVALAISTTSVYLFLLCRGILALGEAGNFPAAIKVTAEYFPKKDRAFATSIFNAGASVFANEVFAVGLYDEVNVVLLVCLNKHFCQQGLVFGVEMNFRLFNANRLRLVFVAPFSLQ